MKSLMTIALMGAIALGTTACERRHKSANKNPKAGAEQKKTNNPDPQLKDECPEAEGFWKFSDGSAIDIARKEGILTIKPEGREETFIADGKIRTTKEIQTGQEVDVIATCNKKVVYLQFFYLGQAKQSNKNPYMRQEWRIDLEKDMVQIQVFQDGYAKPGYSEGFRDYTKQPQVESKKFLPPGAKQD